MTLRHLSFANVASALALTVALTTGTAYAASQLPKNSVTSKQVKNGSLKAADFKAGQLPAGPAGPAGAPAVSLFAAVLDLGSAEAATLGTNKGAVSVSDPAGPSDGGSPYVVTFDRNLTGCVALATSGAPNTTTPFTIGSMAVTISGATIKAFSFGPGGAGQDTSFMVAVYC